MRPHPPRMREAIDMSLGFNLLLILPEIVLTLAALALMLIAAWGGQASTRAVSWTAVAALIGASIALGGPSSSGIDAFDGLGSTATDRAMIAACPLTWPWNILGWPSINVPAGFTSDGLPIGVQLMGPEGSEPLLVSLAAELEAVSDWTARQPEPWWLRAH